MTAADSVRRLEMQNFVFSCGGVLPESGRVGTPAETLFTMGKGLKEFQLCDSRRLRKKAQDAQDDVTELFDLFDAHFWVGKVIEFGLPKGSPQFSTWMFVSSFCLLWFHGFWRTFEAAGCVPSVMSQPQNRIATRSNAWMAALRPARYTKLYITEEARTCEA